MSNDDIEDQVNAIKNSINWMGLDRKIFNEDELREHTAEFNAHIRRLVDFCTKYLNRSADRRWMRERR